MISENFSFLGPIIITATVATVAAQRKITPDPLTSIAPHPIKRASLADERIGEAHPSAQVQCITKGKMIKQNIFNKKATALKLDLSANAVNIMQTLITKYDHVKRVFEKVIYLNNGACVEPIKRL